MNGKRLVDLAKKRIKEDKTLNPIMQKMVSDGLSEDEAISIMINAWVNKLIGDSDE